jgi:hypothetical protein
MHVRVTAEGSRTDDCNLPESVEPFVVRAKSEDSGTDSSFGALLDRIVAPDSLDDSYDKVTDLGEIQLLAEAKLILAAIKDGLRRRSQKPLAESEIIDFG